jgi:hypothetical protein
MLSALALVALATGLLIGVSSSSAEAPAKQAPTRKAPTSSPAYRHYVACGLSPTPARSTARRARSSKV